VLRDTIHLDKKIVIREGGEVFKIGRRGLVQRGKIVKYPAQVDVNKIMRTPDDSPRFAYSMMVESLATADHERRAFQIPGDSGSLAFTKDGKLAGLFFVGVQDDIQGAFHIGHAIPVMELIADIEQVTGAKVRLST
jgi:hypothetical protein